MSLPGAAGPWRRERSVTVGPVTMALTETAGPGDRVFVLVHGVAGLSASHGTSSGRLP